MNKDDLIQQVTMDLEQIRKSTLVKMVWELVVTNDEEVQKWYDAVIAYNKELDKYQLVLTAATEEELEPTPQDLEQHITSLEDIPEILELALPPVFEHRDYQVVDSEVV